MADDFRHLCHCGVFNPVSLCAECQGDLISPMEDPTAVGKFAAFSVKKFIPFLKDVCAFYPPFRSFELNNDCVQVCVCTLVDVEA